LVSTLYAPVKYGIVPRVTVDDALAIVADARSITFAENTPRVTENATMEFARVGNVTLLID
jgi:hypothetical protein